MNTPPTTNSPATLLGTQALSNLSGQACLVSWSGGKDSCLALYRALQAGAQVNVMINMSVEGGLRSRSHGLRRAVIEAQAQALGCHLDGRDTSWADYETNFVSLLQYYQAQGYQAVVFGDIDLQAHLEWEKMVCQKANVRPVLPLWQEDRRTLVEAFIQAGFETRIVAIQAECLSSNILGEVLTHDLVETFESQGVDACGENGEFHTVVTNGPIFTKPLVLCPGERVHRDGYWFLDYDLQT